MLDRDTLDRLVARGRQRVAVSAGNLAVVQPIDGMDVDILVLVMLELGAGGIGEGPEAVGPVAGRVVPAAIDLPVAVTTAPHPPIGSASAERDAASPDPGTEAPTVWSDSGERTSVD